MAIFRIEKTRDYTIMSNHHLRNKTLSLKAKGLLSQMLSLPEDWNYTLKGLSQINRESVDAIRSAIQELEKEGYIFREQQRDDRGSFASNVYVVYEQPQENPPAPQGAQSREAADINSFAPLLENPTAGFPISGNPASGNPTQLNIDIQSKEKPIYPSIVVPQDRIDRMDAFREAVKKNIDYDIMNESYDPERLDELVEIMVEAGCTGRPTLWVAGDEIPAAVVRARLLKLNATHIDYVFECLQRNTTKIYNIKSYLLTTLYNAPLTIGSYYTAEVNHDLHGYKCRPYK